MLVYDGDCDFCLVWIDYWKRLTGDRVDYAPFQLVASRFPEIPLSAFQTSVRLILPDGRVLSGAHAVFQSLATSPNQSWMLWSYENIRGAAPASEWAYRLIASHRDLFNFLTRLLWGNRLEPQTGTLVRWLFLRALGLVYLIAFASFGVQVLGLIGSKGILPAEGFLQWLGQNFGWPGIWLAPTLFWVNSSDTSLQIVPLLGALLALLLILGFTQRMILILLYFAYLSLVVAGQDFMAFQWDVLLLEAGFLAIFLPGSGGVVIWLYRWLVFRLLFMSGAGKLLSGDPTWRNLTALDLHFETQPLPNVIGWYFHQMPEWFHRVSVLGVFIAEVAVPFLIFAPRRLRFLSAGAIVSLQVLIFLTGNYAFFNLLAVALCIFLIDDSAIKRFMPERVVQGIRAFKPATSLVRACTTVLAVLVIFVSGFQLVGMFRGSLPAPVMSAMGLVAPFRIVNTYGLFSVMTTSRPEIVVEGSNDGETWLPYEFKYKVGDVNRAPAWVEPHQPRLDWQMWFAALGYYSDKPWLTERLTRTNPSAAFRFSSYGVDPWFVSFMLRLQEGSPDVLALLGSNPFPNQPPSHLHALLYNYQFVEAATHAATGAWWKRELLGTYFPAITSELGP